MNTSLISKSFTAVVVLLVALNGWGAEIESREECEDKSGNAAEKACADIKEPKCLTETKAANDIKNKCAKKPLLATIQADKKESRAECKEAYDKYQTISEKIQDQCARADQDMVGDCKKLAISCSRKTDVGGLENDGEETEEESEAILKSIYGIFSAGNAEKSKDPKSCYIEDDADKESTNTERLNDKISKLRTDQSSLKEDMAKADDEVAKVKQEVESDILKLEKEMDKKTIERKTEAQKETLKMQQEALDAIKRKKAALKSVEERNRTIANLRIQQQEEAIKFTQSNLMKACRDQALDLKARLIADATKAAAVTKQSTAVTGNIKKDVETFGRQCIKLAGIERNKAFKATLDKITIENSAIKDLNDSIKLDDQAATNRQKDLAEREKITNEEQTKAEQQKTKELGQLSQKVADIQTLVEKKKATLAEKLETKEIEIKELIAKQSNKKLRFQQITSDIRKGESRAAVFRKSCCSQPGYEDFCGELSKDYPSEPEPSKKKTKQKNKT